MSNHVDPDAFHGAVDELITHVNDTDNSATLTANGVDPTKITTILEAIRDDVAGKKAVRDKLASQLETAQQDYAASAAKNYTGFSGQIDAVSGGLGKGTPAAKQALQIRIHLNAAPTHHASPTPAVTSTATTASTPAAK
jgi:hypothetical protein